MKLQKKYLELFYKCLGGYKTDKLAEARIRDSFMKTLAESVDAFIKDRNVIYEKFCEKNEDGSPLIKDNKYNFPREVITDLNQELIILLDEEVEMTPDEKIKEFVENTKYETEAGETLAIDEILKLL